MAVTITASATPESVGTATTVGATIAGATSGRALLFGLLYRDPPGTNAPTSVASNGGETVTAVGVSNANSEGATRRFYVVSSISSTASRRITATFATAVYADAMMWELNGADASNIIDAYNQVNSSYSGGGGTPPTMSLVTTAANSAIFALCDSSGAEPTADTGRGYTLVDLPNYYQYAAAQYLLDAGAAGTKTVEMGSVSFTEWGLSAVAIRAYVATPLSDPSAVTAGTIEPRQATCSWTDNSSGETGFEVQYSPAPYSSWTAAAGSPAAANATSLVVALPSDGTTYKFRVRAAGTNPSSWVESGAFTTTALTRLVPVADIDPGDWTASTGSDLYAMIDEVPGSDSDYITVASASVAVLKLQSSTAPSTDKFHTLVYRVKGDGVSQVKVSLVQGDPGGTEIKSETITPSSGYALRTLALSEAEAADITDYTDLHLVVEAL